MAIERKDCRVKLDADVHAKLKAICDLEVIDMGDWVEQQIVPMIEKRVHAAIALAERIQRLGLTRSADRVSGKSGSARE